MKDDKEIMTKSILETAESASAYAEARLEEVRNEYQKRKIKMMKISCMMIIVSIVLVFATRSWFTMSRDVQGTDANMTASDLPFEVAVSAPYTTNQPDYSTLINTQFSYDITNHETGGSIGGIKCLMIDETADSSNPMRGMQPGSHGTITFKIKPKTTGTYNLHFDLSTVGYHAEFNVNESNGALLPEGLKTVTVDGETVPIFYALTEYAAMQADKVDELEAIASLTQDQQAELANAREDSTNCPKAARFLQGHILFFESQNSSTTYYSDFIKPGIGFDRSFTFTSDDVAGTITESRQRELTITLYWIWPNTFGQIVLDNGNANLSERDAAMFNSVQPADPISGKTPRGEVSEYIASHSNLFFESSSDMFSDTTETAETKIAAAIAGLSSNPDNIIPLSNAYNNADQIIGENVQILFAEITASMD